MKLLLFLEHHFYNIDNEVYCDRIVNYEYLTRYLDAFESVTVCARFSEGKPKKKMKVSGNGVDFLPLPDFIGSSGIIKNYSKIKKIVSSNIHKYDAALMRSPSPISYVAYPIVKKSDIPFAAEIVINPATMFSKDSYHSKLRPIICHAFVSHTKALCKNANGVSYVTEHILQEIYPCLGMKENNRKYFTESYSTIDLHDKNYSEIIHEREANKPFMIAHTGYMDSYSKGHLTVIDVASKLIQEGYNINVEFIGTGALEDEFKKYANDKGILKQIQFCGSLNGYVEVQKKLLLADAFIFPTCSEGLPRSLLEAMANSLACISSPIDGIVELLDTDYLVHYSDVTGFVEVLKNLIDNDDLRKRVAHVNYLKSREYQYDILREKRRQFYLKLRSLCE